MYKENFVEYEHLEQFMSNLPQREYPLFQSMEQYAFENHVPIIKRDVAEYIRSYLMIHQPHRILEVGTAIGYSAIWMTDALGANCHIDTLEIDANSVKIAENNIRRFGYEKQIQIWQGDAAHILPEMNERYDFAFIDAAKGQYQVFWDLILPKMKPGGVILCDNILIRGLVSLPQEQVPKKQSAQVRKMKDFIRYLFEEERVHTLILPIGDGVSVSYVYKDVKR